MKKKYITSAYRFDKILNNKDFSEWMLTSKSGEPHLLIDWNVIKAIICLMRKNRVIDLDKSLSICLTLKDVISYSFNPEVTTVNLLANRVTDDFAHGSIQDTDDQVVFIQENPTKFYLCILTDEAGNAANIVDRLIEGDTEISEEIKLMQQNMDEVPNIFDAYPELEF